MIGRLPSEIAKLIHVYVFIAPQRGAQAPVGGGRCFKGVGGENERFKG